MISAVTDLKACERCDIPPGIAELLRPFEKQLAGKRILTAGGRAGATGACGIEAPRNDGGPKYDVVLLTGLLETANAPQLVLAGATAMLERGGAIMIAVENGLGAGNIGASRGGRAGARLGKQQLTHLIRHAGVRHYRFYYPFPDLNAPSVLLSDDAFGDEQLDVVNLIEPVVTGRSEAGTGAHYLIRALTANGLMKELCDHFFIVLSDNAGWFPDEGILAWTFNPGRRETFKKMTTFYRDDDGALRVRRDPCGTDRRRARGVAVLQQLQDEYYLPGRLYSLRLADIVCSPGWSTADVAAWASPYAELLRSELTLIDDGEWLEGRHLDLVPFNLLTDDRRLTAIDAEWVATEPLPLQYVLFRGIYHTLARIGDVAQPAAGTPLNLYGLCLAVAAQLIADTGGMLETFLTLEPRYFGEVFGGIGTAPADADLNVWKERDNERTSPGIRDRLFPLFNIALQVFIETPGNPFSEETSVIRQIGLTDQRKIYSVRLPWFTDEISRIRIDPSDHKGLLHVHAIHLRCEGEELLYWTPFSRAELQLNGVMIVQAAPAETTPVMILQNFDPMLIFSLPQMTRKNPMAPIVLEIEVSALSQETSRDVLNGLGQMCAMLPQS